MKTMLIIGKVYLYLVGGFFILLALDCFGEVGCPDYQNVWEQLFCFLISSVPGIIVILANYLLRHREFILGIVLSMFSVTAFFFFRFYRNLLEKIPTFLIVVFIPLCIGIAFIYIKKNNK